MSPVPSRVGIIANPLSGSDIRRLVALGSVYGAQEKINIVQRVLAGLQALDVEEIYLMPGMFGIARQALEKLPRRLDGLRARSRLIDMPVENAAADSTCAAREMRRQGVGCIVVLGGDGTTRAVAGGCQDVPILPISTGTNNVVPYRIEGTVAGIAAGFVARHSELVEEVAYRSKRLEVQSENEAATSALVDVAVVEGEAVGSGAIWDPSLLRQVILTRGEPGAVGMSSLAGFLAPVGPEDPWGLCLSLGKPEISRVTVPLAPGLVTPLNIRAWRRLAVDESVVVHGGGRLLALDGEREIVLRRGQAVRIFLRNDGPWIVDALHALRVATEQGFFVHSGVAQTQQALEEPS